MVEILDKYVSEQYSVGQFATDYSVSKNTIWSIIAMKSWKHIK